MRKADYNALPLGVYQVFWKNGFGYSVAALGQLYDGTRWLAPANWTSVAPAGIATVVAPYRIRRMVLIMPTPKPEINKTSTA